MKRTDVRSDSAVGMPTGLMPVSDAAVTAPPALSSPAELVLLRAEPVEPVLPAGPVLPAAPASHRVEPVEPVLPAGPVLLAAPASHRVEPVEPVLPVGPVLPVEGV